MSKNIENLPKTIVIIESRELYTNQARLFAHLSKNNVTISKGYMLKSDGKYHEKGVDVQIALDIAIGAYENSYKTCYLISSDTDLIPAIKKARELNKKIIYVGFQGSQSRAMEHNTNLLEVILTKENLAPFVK